MKMDYDTQTDYLYIRLKEGNYLESEEVASGFVLDFDKEGNVLGIEIEHASEKLDLQALKLIGLSIPVTTSEQKVN